MEQETVWSSADYRNSLIWIFTFYSGTAVPTVMVIIVNFSSSEHKVLIVSNWDLSPSIICPYVGCVLSTTYLVNKREYIFWAVISKLTKYVCRYKNLAKFNNEPNWILEHQIYCPLPGVKFCIISHYELSACNIFGAILIRLADDACLY